MLCVDVNVLVYALNRRAPEHEDARRWLDGVVSGPEPIGISPVVLAGVTRVLTNPRIFEHPMSPSAMSEYWHGFLGRPTTRVVPCTRRTWDVCQELMIATSARGSDVSDALIAASAIEYGAALATCDRGFARFPRLRIVDPLDDGSRR